MPKPPPPSFGVNLRITDFFINNDGRATAIVENVAPSAMQFDAKIRLRRDNVLVKECVWPKTVKKMLCSANMLIRTDVPPPPVNLCNWGKLDSEIHAEIIADLAESQIDTSGHSKIGMLYARQDLFAAYFYEDTITKKIGIVVGNKGPCYATPWSYKFYVDGNLIETGPLFGGLMKRNEYAHYLLQNQDVFTQFARRQSLFKFEVVPQFPEHEQSAGNNVYEVKGLSVAEGGIDIAVTDIKFLGEYYQETYPNSNYAPEGDYYFKILPYIKNIGTIKYPDGEILKIQFFVDNVSVQERNCYPGLAPGEEIPVSNCFASDSNLPTLPAGSHTVRFVVTILDGNIYNNHFVKTMVRP